LIRSLR